MGGAEKLLVGVVNGLKSFDHVIITLKPDNEFGEIINPSVRIICINYKGKPDTLNGRRKIKEVVRKYNISLIHAHLLPSCFLARISKDKIPLICSIHNVLSKSAFNHSKLSWLIEKLFAYKTDTNIFVSKTVKEDYHKTIRKSSRDYVLYNYVEDDFFNHKNQKIQTPYIKIIAVGSLKPQKNYPFLVECLSKLPKEKYKLDIYGEGPERQKLEEVIKTKKVEKNITLKGTYQEMCRILPQYDLFVMASTYEGFGIAPFEAMACRIPCLLSKIEVFTEIIGPSAMYFSPNSQTDFIKKFKEVTQNSKLSNDLSINGYKKAQKIASKHAYLSCLQNIYFNHLESSKQTSNNSLVS